MKLAEIHKASFTLAPRPWSGAEIESLLSSPNAQLFELEGGFAITRTAGPEVELLTIAVHPNFRRQHIAANLMESLKVSAQESGAEEVFLEVSEENTTAISLYKSKGYVVRATRRDYYFGPNGKKINALVMVLEL